MAVEDTLSRFLDFGAKVATPFVTELASRGGATDAQLKAEREYWNRLNGSGAVDGTGFVASGLDTKNLTIPQFNPNAQNGPAATIGLVNSGSILLYGSLALLVILFFIALKK